MANVVISMGEARRATVANTSAVVALDAVTKLALDVPRKNIKRDFFPGLA